MCYHILNIQHKKHNWLETVNVEDDNMSNEGGGRRRLLNNYWQERPRALWLIILPLYVKCAWLYSSRCGRRTCLGDDYITPEAPPRRADPILLVSAVSHSLLSLSAPVNFGLRHQNLFINELPGHLPQSRPHTRGSINREVACSLTITSLRLC